jgi:hypothetical protein
LRFPKEKIAVGRLAGALVGASWRSCKHPASGVKIVVNGPNLLSTVAVAGFDMMFSELLCSFRSNVK